MLVDCYTQQEEQNVVEPHWHLGTPLGHYLVQPLKGPLMKGTCPAVAVAVVAAAAALAAVAAADDDKTQHSKLH